MYFIAWDGNLILENPILKKRLKWLCKLTNNNFVIRTWNWYQDLWKIRKTISTIKITAIKKFSVKIWYLADALWLFWCQRGKYLRFVVLSDTTWLVIFPSEYAVGYQLHEIWKYQNKIIPILIITKYTQSNILSFSTKHFLSIYFKRKHLKHHVIYFVHFSNAGYWNFRAVKGLTTWSHDNTAVNFSLQLQL